MTVKARGYLRLGTEFFAGWLGIVLKELYVLNLSGPYHLKRGLSPQK